MSEPICPARSREDTLLSPHLLHELRLFFRRRARGHEDDLLQQTAFKAVASLSLLKDDAAFRAYVFTIARRTLFDHRRGARRLATMFIDHDEPSLIREAPPPGKAWAESEGETSRWWTMVAHVLPDELREVVVLAFLGGMTREEIATELRIPTGTVSSRLRRGVDRLRTAFEEEP